MANAITTTPIASREPAQIVDAGLISQEIPLEQRTDVTVDELK